MLSDLLCEERDSLVALAPINMAALYLHSMSVIIISFLARVLHLLCTTVTGGQGKSPWQKPSDFAAHALLLASL